ncbi:site-specific DNA-methyltransferase [Vibrio vulnificus]|uniref:site-specific DNA-methyltransferase n=1 Tax=Vibrio vulnificus TaxID=672 RepID=UPI0013EE5EE3|nr:site-specific DNA-methyltransferase [Vibrio vulnificus]
MANEEQQTNVEKYEFEPIKGYPMLNWKGKRPFRSTQYFPAQLKEVYGKEDENGWINKIFWGDNLQVMSHLLKEYRGSIDLVYIDPPFDSKADYKKSIKIKSKTVSADASNFEEKQYTDIWSNDEFLQFMYERLTLLKELLSSTGSIFLHCDYRKASHLKIMMDEIFGQENFRAQICWRSMTSSGFKGKTSLGRSHADILYYSKSDEYKYSPVYKEYSDEYIKERFSKIDENGRQFKDEKVGSATPKETIEKWKSEGRIYVTSTGGYRIKHYLDEAKGMIVDDVWTDIFGENSQSKELTGYPTQKPNALLERIIKMASDEGDVVFDCFMGSGTTQSVANRLNRRFLGADINLGSIQTTTKRLANDNANFEVYNVNNYDVFRNPVEAKDLLIEALEIQKLDSNVVYDGEKDGYKVKIMPVNRIATKEDLNELVANFPYKKFEERKAANPNKPVEEIMLVCMGHEPGLGATLENECGYKLKVEVVDILRDKSDLTFKYDSEAVIKVQDGKLIVDAFYPRNLLQKLSQQKDDVAEWREMVESIMIDWNYDGAVMEPVVIDIPDKNEFVAGEYEIPEGASNIKIKITDLLSESYEEVIAHG